VKDFEQEVQRNDHDTPEAIIAIQTLIKYIEQSNVGTLQQLIEELQELSSLLKSAGGTSTTSVVSGCDLFVRFITLMRNRNMGPVDSDIWESKSFDPVRCFLLDRGKQFMKRLMMSRKKIAQLAYPFITDGVTVLTVNLSRVVLEILCKAHDKMKKFQVLVTVSEPDKQGAMMVKALRDKGIQATQILDCSIGFVMERVDFILVGAVGVVENGGLINKIGTYPVAVMAKSLNKPFYVAVESFKFYRNYPLCQLDLPNDSKYLKNEEKGHPSVDFTPPNLINKLFTDLGVLTPSAVSDELIKLYI